MSQDYEQYENAGMDVVHIGKDGKMKYATNMELSDEYCDSCTCLQFQPDPDPTDWFRDDDQKAICTALQAQIAGSLEPRELTKICRPLFCPKLANTLTDEQKKEAEQLLGFAKKRLEE